MEYNKYECELYNIYTIKTNSFKNCYMEILFKSEINKNTITKRTFLTDMLVSSSKKHKTIRELNIAKEELYNVYINGILSRVGNTLFTNYCLSFLNPKYTEKKMAEESIKFLFDVLNNPNITDGKFDENTFKIVKNNLHAEISSEKERPNGYAIRRMLLNMDEDSPFSIKVSGYLEDLEEITPQNLVETYNEVFVQDSCDIFIIGDLDMDKIVKLIKKYFKPKYQKQKNLKLTISSKTTNKVKTIKETDDFNHAYLVMGLNLEKLNEYEKHIVMGLYNIILGAGSLDTKLYKYLRTDNSLCYNTRSLYQKYDSLLLITAGIDAVNFNKAVQLVKKALKEMSEGNITEQELEESKKYIITSLTMAYDSLGALINNYVFNTYDKLPDIETRIKKIKKVTIEDIKKVAKKVKLNTIYLLQGAKENGKN